ncbi:MAG: NosD domain-containing protein [Candidatus Bathyarchaeia archaeon]|nr:NosD domain-containing protein [Candidatus Bathyarchaeia archaeon]
MNKAILASFTILCLLSILFLTEYKISAKAGTDVIYVPTDYPTIQEAINHANSGDTIFVYNGTYYEHVVINKSISLIGEDRHSTIIDGGGTGSVISITANNVSIKGFTIRKSGTSSYNSGIFIDRSTGNDISHNTITNNNYGISLYYSSNNLVSDNTITNNYDGIILYYSGNNVFSRNKITDNDCGILLFDSSRNVIFHNNFVNNIQQAYSYSSINVWDNGKEGNYWSDYTGVDLYSNSYQNETGWDGIGDIPYKKIEENNIDNYPLMGMFSVFNVALERETYYVTTICNSTISEFRFEIGSETGNKIIRFNATGKDSTVGFCRVAIPTELMNYPYIVLVDMEEIVPIRLDVSNETYVYTYFTYIHSSHAITIISSKTLYLYNELLDKHVKLQMDLYDLNALYYDFLKNYSILLGNYSQLQESYSELNHSYQEHLSDYSKNVHNIRNLMYIFAATTAIFIITTIYLSKHAHANKTKVFAETPKKAHALTYTR